MARADVLHWNPSDYLSDYKCQALSLESHGAYMTLLWHMWTGSDSQCSFPVDYHALSTIWKVPPEEATRLLDTLIDGNMAVLKVKTTRNGALIVSKRLQKQKEQADSARDKKVQAGKQSGRVRRGNATNTEGTPFEQCSSGVRTEDELSYPVSRKHVSRNPVSRVCSKDGSYPQGTEGVVAYWSDKLDRDLNDDEVKSVSRWVKTFGSDETCVQIGYAVQDGYVDNPRRIGGALKASKQRRDGAS